MRRLGVGCLPQGRRWLTQVTRRPMAGIHFDQWRDFRFALVDDGWRGQVSYLAIVIAIKNGKWET